MIYKLIKLHHKYLWSRFHRISLGIIILLLFISYLVSLQPFLSEFEQVISQPFLRSNYYHQAIVSSKIMVILVSSYLFGNAFTPKSDNYNVLYISFYKERFRYFFGKVLTLIVTEVLLVSWIFILYLACGYFFSRWFRVTFDDFFTFVQLLILGICYGLLAINFASIMKTSISALLPFFLYLTSELISTFSKGGFVYIVHALIPSLLTKLQSSYLIFGVWHLIFLCFCYFLIASFIYIKQDF